MASIYHIENDIDCKVFHFGKELCIAKAGDDCVITLLKGRHKLTFESLDNSNDAYTIVFEVLEDGIEDFIDVEIASIKEGRLQREHQEQARQAELERKHKEEEQKRQAEIERKRKEAEQEKLAELKRQEEIRLKQEKEIEEKKLIREHGIAYKRKIEAAHQLYAKYSDVDNYMIDGLREYNGLRWHKDTNGLYCLAQHGTRLTESVFSKVSRFSCGLALVQISGRWSYVDYNGRIVHNGQEYQSGSHYYEDEALVVKNSKLILIDKEGNTKQVYDDDSPLTRINHGVHVLYEDTKGGYAINVVNVITKERIASIAIKHHLRWLGMTWADYGYSEDHSFEGLGYKKKSYYGLSKNGWLGLGTSKVGDISYRYYINSIGRIVEYKDLHMTCAYFENQLTTFIFNGPRKEVYIVDEEGIIIKPISWELFDSIRNNR